MVRFGFAVRALGIPAPVGPVRAGMVLARLHDVLRYLAHVGVGFYRLPGELLPGPGERTADLEALYARVAGQGVRLTVHADMYVTLGSQSATVAAGGAAVITALASGLERLGLGPEGVIVVHTGGSNGNARAACARFARQLERLPAAVSARLVVEHDTQVALADLLWLHARTGIPIVFDLLHHQIHNPEAMPLAEALALALASWPVGLRPKVHLSSQRTEAHLVGGRGPGAIVPPRLGQHADFVSPFDAITLLQASAELRDHDVMLEAKAADLALLRLRQDLARLAPALAALEERDDVHA